MTGRYASLAAAVVVALTAEGGAGRASGSPCSWSGSRWSGSLVGGASIALVGMVFTGVAAVTAQLASTTRGATGLAAAVLGVSFALAALGTWSGPWTRRSPRHERVARLAVPDRLGPADAAVRR